MKTLERSRVASRVFGYGRKSMRWADGFIAVDWGTTNRRAYLIDPSGQCVDEFEDGKGVLSVPAGGFPGSGRRDPRAPRRPAAAARRNGRVEPRLDGSALRALPRRDRRSRDERWSGPGARGDRSRRLLHRRRAAPTSCAARKCSCSARSRRAWSSHMDSSAIPARTTNGRRCAGGKIQISGRS